MPGPATPWMQDTAHRDWLLAEARRQFAFFAASPAAGPGFHTLDHDGAPMPGGLQELHATTRMVHSYALASALGVPAAPAIIDRGMAYLWSHHRDMANGGYVWSLNDQGVVDGTKLAYGHVFVLLAASSAREAGHPDADRLLADISAVLDRHFWDEDAGLFREEFGQDWSKITTYRGMNANMHGVEALLAAFEATGRAVHLTRAGRILDFFLGRIGPAHDWRLPEHYDESWQVDRAYVGNPIFRPPGSTPGHSFELGRLALQWWDLAGRPVAGQPGGDMPLRARALIDRALADGWDIARGGVVYTIGHDGKVGIPARYWWPVTEAIGALSALLKLGDDPGIEDWYRRMWAFADQVLIDHARGGWFPEVGPDNRPDDRQFKGKPDIYHSVQAALLPLVPGLSRLHDGLRALPETKG